MHKMLTKNPNFVNIKVKKKTLLEKKAGFDRFRIKNFWHELRFKKMVECSLPQSNVLYMYLHVTLCIGYVFILIIIR